MGGRGVQGSVYIIISNTEEAYQACLEEKHNQTPEPRPGGIQKRELRRASFANRRTGNSGGGEISDCIGSGTTVPDYYVHTRSRWKCNARIVLLIPYAFNLYDRHFLLCKIID